MYYFKLYYESTLLRDSRDMEEYFETYEEAEEEAETVKEERIEQWVIDDAWNEYDSEDQFDIYIDYEEVDEDESDI